MADAIVEHKMATLLVCWRAEPPLVVLDMRAATLEECRRVEVTRGGGRLRGRTKAGLRRCRSSAHASHPLVEWRPPASSSEEQ
jgi:hypothetical protein